MVAAIAAAQPSLRTIAKTLKVSHVSLSQAIRAGRLSAGVMIDQHDRAVVTDAAAVIAQWHEVHTPRYRMPAVRAMPTPRPPPAADPLDVVLYDRANDREITGRELLAELAASNLLVSAQAALLLDDRAPEAIRAQIAEQLRDVAGLHAADAAAIALAEQDLESTLWMLTEDDE